MINKLTPKSWVKIVFVILFLLWWGVPTFNKWRADRLVDELCAKDGGVKVYETVTLPKERFNQLGHFDVRFKRYQRSDDEFYLDYMGIDIIGQSNSTDISKLTVFKSISKIYRKSDAKLLGESFGYARRGGDPFGPWHPSHYSCQNNVSERDLVSKIIQKQP